MPRDLGPDEKARMTAFGDAVREVVDSAGDEEGFTAAFAQMSQIASGISPEDMARIRDSVHVPDDAGEHEEGLRRIMTRIPDGWGRWISCDKGWYGILTGLDKELSRFAPGYEVHQVKEKYGGLSYYAAPRLGVADESLPKPEFPKGGDPDSDAALEWERLHEIWCERQDAYRASPEGQRLVREAQARRRLFEAAIKDAEELAARTCETCGAPGQMCLTRAASPWHKTLCPSCAADGDYIKASEYDAWWEDERPRFQARMKAQWQERHSGKRFAVISSDESKALGVEATYVRDPASAAQVALADAGDWDGVFVDDDAVGRAYMDALAERWHEHVAENQRVREEAWTQRPPNNAYKVKRPEGLPSLYYLSRSLPAPSKLFTQDLGVSCLLSQDEHFA